MTHCPIGSTLPCTQATGLTSQLDELGVTVAAGATANAAAVSGVRRDLTAAVATARVAHASIAANAANITALASDLVDLAENVTNNTRAVSGVVATLCTTEAKLVPGAFQYIGQLPNGRGKQSNRGIPSGNALRWGTIAAAHHANDMFDGIYVSIRSKLVRGCCVFYGLATCPRGARSGVAAAIVFDQCSHIVFTHCVHTLPRRAVALSSLPPTTHCELRVFDASPQGNWGTEGATYRGVNNVGGGMEIRFAAPTRLSKWIVYCIRNGNVAWSRPGYNGGDGGVCSGQGGCAAIPAAPPPLPTANVTSISFFLPCLWPQ